MEISMKAWALIEGGKWGGTPDAVAVRDCRQGPVIANLRSSATFQQAENQSPAGFSKNHLPSRGYCHVVEGKVHALTPEEPLFEPLPTVGRLPEPVFYL